MKAPLYSVDGKKKGEVELNAEVWGVRVNARLLELAKNGYAANLRHGTADTKTRKEVQGGGRKPWKQKGTGRARHSSIRSPIWRGGGTTFGPHPRSYYMPMPETMRKSALISALSQKAKQEKVVVLEDLQLKTAKTKEFVGIVNALPLDNRRTLCVVKDLGQNLKRASGNVEYLVDIRRASDVNAFDVLQREKLLISRDAVEVLEKRLGGAAASGNKKS